jgi:hypothetical protein
MQVRYPDSIADKTRFGEAKELQSLKDELVKTNEKARSLQRDAGDKADHPAYQKSVIYADVVAKLDGVIGAFNEEAKPDSEGREIESLLRTVQMMRYVVRQALDNEGNYGKLTAHQSHIKKTIANVVTQASTAGSIAAGTFGFAPMIASFFYVRPPLVSYVDSWANEIATSAVILNNLGALLKKIEVGLQFKLENLPPSERPLPKTEIIVCPITLHRIEYPIFCLLDGRVYEKNAIEEWLTRKGSSPVNPSAKLNAGQDKTSVLIDCISIRGALEEIDEQYAKAKKVFEMAQKAKEEQDAKEWENQAEGMPVPAPAPRMSRSQSY